MAYYFILTAAAHRAELLLGTLYAGGMTSCLEEGRDPITLTCYFETEKEGAACRKTLQEQGESPEEVCAQAEEDWNARWRESIQPVRIGDTLVVSPKWLEPELRDGDRWIRIEPRMAFGTGHHETTQLCTDAICRMPAESILDIGTGTGILLFAAAFAGYKRALGIEIDPACADNLAENIIDNPVEGAEIEGTIMSVHDLPGEAHFDRIVMNIIKQHSLPLLEAVLKHLSPTGRFFWSGLLVTEREEVIHAAQDAGLALTDEESRGEWWLGVFRRA
ncbi:MAG: 50S ribosomal protein L11 methyltransferase [Fibrobacterota bacterium]